MNFTRIINSYLHHVFERKCTKFCLKCSSYSILGHIRQSFGCEILGKGESCLRTSPAHPCLTNSRGDSSLQGVINVYGQLLGKIKLSVSRQLIKDAQCYKVKNS